MSLRLPAAAVATALLAACAHLPGATPASPAAANEQAARATFASLNDACAARDLGAFMALFDEDGEVLLVGSDRGEVFRGREAARGFARMLFAQPFTFSFVPGELLARAGDDHAWLYFDGTMARTGDRGTSAGKASSTPYRFSVAMVKRGAAWKWQLFHGAVPGAE